MSNLDPLIRYLRQLKELLLDNQCTGLGLRWADINQQAKPVDVPALPAALIVPLVIDDADGLGACQLAVILFRSAASPDATLELLELAGELGHQVRRYADHLGVKIERSQVYTPGIYDLKPGDPPKPGADSPGAVLFVPLHFVVRFTR